MLQIDDSVLCTGEWESIVKFHLHVALALEILQLDTAIQVGKDEAFLAPLRLLQLLLFLFSHPVSLYSHSHPILFV